MSGLIIRSKFDSGRGKTAITISLDSSVKDKIDSIALSTGHSFSELVEIFLKHGLENCVVDDGSAAKSDSSSAKSVHKEFPKTVNAANLKEKQAEKPAAEAPAAEKPARTIAKTTTVKAEPAKTETKTKATAEVKTTTAAKSKTITAEKDEPKTTKTVAKTTTVAKTAKTKESDLHAAVPTFKLPPITKPK